MTLGSQGAIFGKEIINNSPTSCKFVGNFEIFGNLGHLGIL
jgi:hypothetical protein